MNVEGGFSIIALMDGTTLNGFLRVEGAPLVQRYIKGTDTPIPNFQTMPESERPTIILLIRDLSSGTIVPAQSVTWKYNGVAINFASSGLSTGGNVAGKFKKIDKFSTNVGGVAYELPALRIMDNLVAISNHDNDRISVTGTVEVKGQSVPFQELGKDVVIQESTGNAYDVVITDNKGSALATAGESLTCTATLYKDGVKISDYSGFSFKWMKLLGSGDVQCSPGNARTQVISTKDIDNVLKLRCDVMQGGNVIVSGFTQISDFSDPYYVEIQISGTGVVGNALRYGQIATVKPVARKRSDGSINASATNWSFNIKNNEGDPFIIPGKDGPTFNAATVAIKYDDVIKAKGGINGSVSITI